MSIVSFFKKAKELSERLDSWNRDSKVIIIGHRDGDGIAATTTLNQGLKALKFEHIVPKILLSPEVEILESIIKENSPDYIITCDIGADFAPILGKKVTDFIISDHHPNKSRDYSQNQLNCIEFGFDDEVEASGSTTVCSLMLPLFDESFWTTDKGKVILAYAISGAVSDFQFLKGISKINEIILNMAKINGAVKVSKDISIFGRGLYPVPIALNRSGIPGFMDQNFCYDILGSKIELKEEGYWKRIVDLEKEEKQQLTNIIIEQLSTFSHKINIKDFLAKEVIGNVFDLTALYGWDCTRIPDGRFTLDPREILHQINYCCRLGNWDIALDLLNEPCVSDTISTVIDGLHKEGDREIASALDRYNKGIVSVQRACDDKIILADFTDLIFYDQVGVIAGVIMKQDRDIDIMLSSCSMNNDEFYKVSVRARDKIWEMVDQDNEFADANKVYEKTKFDTKTEIKYGGHRFAMSGYMPKDIIPILFENMVNYYNSLKE